MTDSGMTPVPSRALAELWHTMNGAAEGTGTHSNVLLSIASDPSGWSISDYPSHSLGEPWTETFHLRSGG